MGTATATHNGPTGCVAGGGECACSRDAWNTSRGRSVRPGGVHAARKVIGVGTRAWIVLMLGNDNGQLSLQLKEADVSVLRHAVDAGTTAVETGM
jgi:hypothetical protein